MSESEKRIDGLEDRIQALEYWVEQNKKNITGLYTGGHVVERKTKKIIQWLWIALAVSVSLDIGLLLKIAAQ